jgi:Ser/Thr protein kinase RdoA (MazF antagonist)
MNSLRKLSYSDDLVNIKNILYSYDIKFFSDVQLLGEPTPNSKNYLVTTSNSKYVLHEFLDGSSIKKIETMCKILDYCYKKNSKVLKPLKNNQKKYVSNKNFFMTYFYDGKHFEGKNIEILSIAKNLAILHKTLLNNKINYNFRLHQNYYHILKLSQLEQIFSNIEKKEKLNSFDLLYKQEINFLKSTIHSFNQNLKHFKQYENSKQLIHHDLHPKNVIFKNGKVNAIIDFSAMRKGNIFEDIAFSSYRFASNKNYKNQTKNKIHVFLNEYVKYNDVKLNPNQLMFSLTKIFLERISLIIKMNYFSNKDSWNHDFKNHLIFLKDILSKDFFNY